jgi:predicted dehydrogenase
MNDRYPTALGIGLVGVGRHGSRYVQHLLHDLPEARLTAICRRSGGAYPGLDVPVYDDYRALIRDAGVEAVVVVTPPSLCHRICLSAVEAGKAVLVEKPLAINGREARAMVRAAEEAQVPLMTAQTMRFDSTILRLRELLPTIGRLHSATLISHIETKANTTAGAQGPVALGALLELGIHLLDLIRYLTGEEICEVRCTMTPSPDTAPETRVQAQIRTSVGTLCMLDIARVDGHRHGRGNWTGSEGAITVDWVRRHVTRTTKEGASQSWTLEPRATILATLQAFVHAVRTRTAPPITGLDGCRAVEAADACYHSAAINGAVVPCEPAAD